MENSLIQTECAQR